MCLAATLTVGCSGSGRVALIPLNSARLELKEPLEVTFQPSRCYWWTDDAGRFHLALQFHNFSPLGHYTRNSFEMTLQSPDPHQPSQGQFKASGGTARAIWHRRSFHLRLSSYRGVVALAEVSPNFCSGQFRLFCRSEKFFVLTGWQRHGAMLLQGRFTAVHDPRRGGEIAQRVRSPQPGAPPETPATFVPGSR